VSVHPSGAVQLSTIGNHSVAGASGDRSDVLQCMPADAAPITSCYWLSSFDGGAAGYGAETIGAMSTAGMVGYYTDFDAPLGADWEIYDSVGHAGWGLRRPSAVEVGPGGDARTGGLLTITAKMGSGDEAGLLVSGGVKVRFPQIYGNYLVRTKVEPDPDGVTSGAVLLWPESNQHPRDGEIDILESWSNRETRTPVESNLHWLRPGAEPPFTLADDYKAQVVHPGVDGTQWHVFELEWREDLVSVAVDGGTPVILSTDPAEIADWNMEPTIQLDAFDAFDAPGQQPSLSGEVLMSVDYLIVRP
ncbi:MAG: glycoside hydrolase family 16 protein, partial [Actinomycetota bacterium]